MSKGTIFAKKYWCFTKKMLASAKLRGSWYKKVNFLKLHMCVYLCTKLQVSSIILTKLTQIRVKYDLCASFSLLIEGLHRCIQNPLKNLNGAFCENSSRVLVINCFHQKLHLRSLAEFWIRTPLGYTNIYFVYDMICWTIV